MQTGTRLKNICRISRFVHRQLKFYLAAVLFFSSAFNSYSKEYLFSNVDNKNGLSHNKVMSFYRDSKGYMWVGTWDGLCRYDGYSIRVFKNNPADTVSISGNRIDQLFEAPDGKLWISANGIFNIYNPQQNSFASDSILQLGSTRISMKGWWKAIRDKKENIWISNGLNIYCYDPEQDTVNKAISVSNQRNQLEDELITDLGIDPMGNIWYISRNASFGKVNMHDFSIVNRQQLNTPAHGNYKLLIDSDGDFWFYVNEGADGLLHYNLKRNEFSRFSADSEANKLSSNIITGAIESNNGIIWIATDHGGINLIDKRDFKIKNILNDPAVETSLCQNSITEIYKDYNGYIWVGSVKKGFSYFHPDLYMFSNYRIRSDIMRSNSLNDMSNIVEDAAGNLWIGTDGEGLFYWNRGTNTFTNYRHDPDDPHSLSSDVIVGLCIDHLNRLWVGTYQGGMDFFDGKQFRNFRHVPGDESSLSDNSVWDIFEDAGHKLWVSTISGGVNVFDPKSMEVIETYKWSDDLNSIQTNVVYSVSQDAEGNHWFATKDGLRKKDSKTGLFYKYIHQKDNLQSLSSNEVNDVFIDSRGLIWAATYSGINILNPNGRTFTHITEVQGMPSNTILQVVEDQDGNMWVSTPKAISKLELINDTSTVLGFQVQITSFEGSGGLQAQLFNERAALLSSSGEIIFGGFMGLSVFNPHEIAVFNIPFNIVFTKFHIQGSEVFPQHRKNGKVILDTSIDYTKQITLEYFRNSFSVEFAALNFYSPGKRRYKYMLEGFNEDWIVVESSNRRASYTNLDPGKYLLRVRATDNDGNWSETEAKLKIKVLAPWWRALWFKVLVILVPIILVFVILRYRIYMLKIQRVMLNRNVEVRTAELQEANKMLVVKQSEISRQNKELEQHRNNLEKLVEERTTELQAAFKQVEESDRLKSSFLANMSHEIRTPLNAIMGFATMLQVPDLTESERKEYADIVNNSCDSLLGIINDILDISMIEANQLEIIAGTINVDALLEEIETSQRRKSRKEIRVEFVRNSDYQDLHIENDAERLRQVLTNLVSNALTYTQKGSIEFGYTVDDSFLTFYVSDTGIGIEKAYLNSIFNHFHKLERDETILYRGTGLGLSISKRLVELMGGRIWVESEVDKGSTFYFTLPNNYSAELEGDEGSDTLTVPDLRGYHILICEDEEANYHFLNRLLQKTKASVYHAENGEEAIRFVKNLKGNHTKLLILMDIRMPFMNGIKALELIKKIDQEIIVIAVTAFALEDEKRNIMKKGFNAYIAKPVNNDELFSLIHKLTSQTN